MKEVETGEEVTGLLDFVPSPTEGIQALGSMDLLYPELEKGNAANTAKGGRGGHVTSVLQLHGRGAFNRIPQVKYYVFA